MWGTDDGPGMNSRTLATDRRGLSREGVVALGFGLTIAMMAVVGGVLMQTEGALDDASSGPTVSTSAESLTAGDGPDDQWVRINHEQGARIAAENVSITVWLPEHHKRSTLEALPTDRVEPDDYDHNHIFTLGDRGIGGAIDAENDDAWSAGETISFRLSSERVRLQPGHRVNVTVTHVPSETTLGEHSLTAE